ncbi:MAG: FGGY family carbohydrate kinase [Candidatus Brocadiia bacterium]
MERGTVEAFIGIDIGTTSICGVALNAGGELLASARRANDSHVEGLPSSRREASPNRVLELCVEVLRDVTERLRETGLRPVSVGLAGQMHGGLVLGDGLEPLTNFITWQDERAGEEVGDGGPTFLEQFMESADEQAVADTGCRPSTGYLGLTLYWMNCTQSLPEGARGAAFIHDWVAAKLCGNAPVTSPGNAASTGLFNVRAGEWEPRLLAVAGIAADLLPPVLEAGTPMGTLCPEMAEATGLTGDTTVHTPLGDNQASVLASLSSWRDQVVVNVGTGGQVSAVTDRFIATPDLEARPFVDGRMLCCGASLRGGAALDYLAHHYRRVLESIGDAGLSQAAVLDRLVELAREAPGGADGLIVEPFFGGRRADSSARGRVGGMTDANNTPGHWARAFIEGIVAELGSYYRAMKEEGLAERSLLVGSGNGMRLNDVMRDAAVGAFCMPAVLPAWQEESACGAALAAMVGVGAVPSFEQSTELVRHEQPSQRP